MDNAKAKGQDRQSLLRTNGDLIPVALIDLLTIPFISSA